MADRLFEGEEAILHVIERIVAPLGLRVDATSPWVDATSPWVDARLPNGSRVQRDLHAGATTCTPAVRAASMSRVS